MSSFVVNQCQFNKAIEKSSKQTILQSFDETVSNLDLNTMINFFATTLNHYVSKKQQSPLQSKIATGFSNMLNSFDQPELVDFFSTTLFAYESNNSLNLGPRTIPEISVPFKEAMVKQITASELNPPTTSNCIVCSTTTDSTCPSCNTFYCSHEHRAKHWPNHRKSCVERSPFDSLNSNIIQAISQFNSFRDSRALAQTNRYFYISLELPHCMEFRLQDAMDTEYEDLTTGLQVNDQALYQNPNLKEVHLTLMDTEHDLNDIIEAFHFNTKHQNVDFYLYLPTEDEMDQRFRLNDGVRNTMDNATRISQNRRQNYYNAPGEFQLNYFLRGNICYFSEGEDDDDFHDFDAFMNVRESVNLTFRIG